YGYYLRHVDAAGGLIYPHVVRLPVPVPATVAPAEFAGSADALAWLDAERTNLVCAIRDGVGLGLVRPAWQLADAGRGYLHHRMHLLEWETIARAGLTAAEVDGEPEALASAQLSITVLTAVAGWYPEALDHGRWATTHARRAGWTAGEAAALNALGAVQA